MAEFKFFCPQCGQQVQCDTGYVGTQINCPACQQTIVVPQLSRPAAAAQIPAKSQTLRNVLVIAVAVIVLAGLVIVGWFGWSKIAMHKMPPGLVALWSGNGNDSAGANKMELTDISFARGKTGTAFSFNGTESSIKIPASKSLNVGAEAGFTVMAWIKPTDVTRDHPLFEWNDLTYWGVHFHIAPGQPSTGSSGPGGPGQLYANIVDSSGGWHQLGSAAGVVKANVFQHVALTYDKTSGVATIYCDGGIVSRQHLGSFNTRTARRDLYIGRRPAPSGEINTFAGLMEEPALFNRALSASEIQEIYQEQN